MAISRGLLGPPMLERPSSLARPSSMSSFLHGGGDMRRERLRLCADPLPARRTRPCSSSTSSKGKVPVVKATVSERRANVAGAGGDPVKLKVRASVTIRKKAKEDIRETITRQWDAVADKIGWNVVLQLVSEDIDPKRKNAKKSGEAALKDWSEKMNAKGDRVICTAEFAVDSAFGVPGAITVLNRHQKEFFLESVVVEGLPCGPVHFPCNSWVQSSKDHPKRRAFFYNKPLLPSETPPGLAKLREEELKELRGDGTGARKLSDRIYDYDVYNDLGNPDKGVELARPVLGGAEFPYPRRCRTGRPASDSDLRAERRVEKPQPVYVPRDEAFDELKQGAFLAGRLRAVLHSLVPSIVATISADKHDFASFHDLDILYKEGLLLKMGLQDHLLRKIPLVRHIQDSSQGLLRYDTPSILSKDKFAWLRDDDYPYASEDPAHPHGLRLLIDDYPYASDGLLIWSAIQDWVRAYVDAYYPTADAVRSDVELQQWYWESVNVGHRDKRHAEWWPELDTPASLGSTLTTLIWLSSAQHASLNFGQYPLGGYVPNRSPMIRRMVPEEGEPEYAEFLANPHRFFLSAMPSLLQATKFMAVVDTLSTHSPDEEYLGQRQQPSTWTGDARMVEAFYRFAAEVRGIEREIERRNRDTNLRNRCGAGVLPYELMMPSSPPGVTGRGVPNSVSI